ncbi:MAG: hypothetical protein HZB53_01550 [Chloroflexi bacterium]|nr:hypothetical protein [Chloroflexota bacterium]
MSRSQRAALMLLLVLALFSVTCSIGPVTISLDQPTPTPAATPGSLAVSLASPTAAPAPTQTPAPIERAATATRPPTAPPAAASPTPTLWFPPIPLPTRAPTPAGKPQFSTIVMCEDVTDDGAPVNPTTRFQADTTKVWAYFTFANMPQGQAWGRRWTRDGQIYLESYDEAWDEDADGWLAYSLEDEDGLAGRFVLTLFIGDQAVQAASFEVAPPSAPPKAKQPSFGPINFGRDITDDNDLLGAATVFEPGTKRVYATFVYFNFTPGVTWSREWLRDGKSIGRSDLKWEEAENGVDYAYLNSSDGSLSPGRYTFNLYLGGTLQRGAEFEVLAPKAQPTATPRGPARPEEVVEPSLLPAWYKVAGSRQAVVREVAQTALKFRIPIRLENFSGTANGYYATSSKSCNTQPGTISIRSTFFRDNSVEAVAATMAHEMTHAMRRLENGAKCGCTVQDEYYAYLVLIYTLQDLNRKDLILERYSRAYDSRGKFSQGLLWQWIKQSYDCPEY